MFAPVKGFKGLNNVDNPLKLDWHYQTRADNVEITDEGNLQRARGYAQTAYSASLISGAYATEDFQRLYVIDGGSLRALNPGLTSFATLTTGLAMDRAYFAEANGQVFFSNGTDYGWIVGNEYRAWRLPLPAAPACVIGSGILAGGVYRVTCTQRSPDGRESGNGDVVALTVPDNSAIHITAPVGASVYVTRKDDFTFYLLAEAVTGPVTYSHAANRLGANLRFLNASPVRGLMPAFYGGRCFVAEYFPGSDMSVIWPSLPLAYSHFHYGDGLAVPGEVRVLCASEALLGIGTDRGIYEWDGNLKLVAPFGVVPGHHACKHRGHVYIWTLRGAARLGPFQNLTGSNISVAPGLFAGGTVVEQQGMRRYVVALRRGGDAFNPG
jgi:hypothetical protein